MKDLRIEIDLISCCWLYCGACEKYLEGKCPGCKNLYKTPFWCKIRDCCLKNGYQNCSQCVQVQSLTKCRKFNGFIMRNLARFCGSDQWEAIRIIKNKGMQSFAEEMTNQKAKRIPRKK